MKVRVIHKEIPDSRARLERLAKVILSKQDKEREEEECLNSHR